MWRVRRGAEGRAAEIAELELAASGPIEAAEVAAMLEEVGAPISKAELLDAAAALFQGLAEARVSKELEARACEPKETRKTEGKLRQQYLRRLTFLENRLALLGHQIDARAESDDIPMAEEQRAKLEKEIERLRQRRAELSEPGAYIEWADTMPGQLRPKPADISLLLSIYHTITWRLTGLPKLREAVARGDDDLDLVVVRRFLKTTDAVSHDSKGVRFVALAIVAIGWPKMSLEAIEQALRRKRNRKVAAARQI